MNSKLLYSLFLSISLLHPVVAKAVDTSTDSPGQYVDDATVTVRVKAAFAQDQSIMGREISVRTDMGVVDLTGNVNTQLESDHATQLATKIKSVKSVHNNLMVTTH